MKYGGNLGEEKLATLSKDIKDTSQKFPIIVHNGEIVDGVQRYRACLRAGVTPVTIEYDVKRWGDSDAGIKNFIISANVHRRHDAKRQRAIIAELLKENPTKSDRAIAKEAKTHHHAVAAVRREEEGRGNISHVKKRTDSKGRKQPASKSKAKLTGVKGSKPSPEIDLLQEPCTDGNSPEEFWQRSLSNFAGEAISMTAFWKRQFGDWQRFGVTPEILTLASQAAEAWSELLSDLKTRSELRAVAA
jgi:ParB-like chromosome segregation protein Spo0J